MAKKNIFKKTLALALAATFILGAAPLAGLCGLGLPSFSSITANAAEEEPVWTDITDVIVVENNIITGVKDGATVSGNIEIPSKTKEGIRITGIGPSAFYGNASIAAVKIPETMLSIGEYAFANCGIEKVYFNAIDCELKYDNNDWRETTPFVNNSKLTYFEFGESVTDIPADACCNITSLATVVFRSNRINSIGNYAFYNCTSLEEIDISTVKDIGEEAFYNCASLKAIDNNNTDGKIVFSDNLTKIGACAFQSCDSFKEVTIPEGVTKIGVLAFADNNIEKVYFNAKDCEIEIGIHPDENPLPAFINNSKLTAFEFGSNVTDIPDNACHSLSSLNDVIFKSENLNNIGNRAFYECTSLEEIDISTVKNIGEEAFYNCASLKAVDNNNTDGKIVFSDNLTKIGACAFQSCDSFKEVTIPEGVTEIDVLAFADNNIEKVYFNAKDCTTEIGIHPSMRPVPPFRNNSKLTYFEFGNNVENIPENVCNYLTNLEKVVINTNKFISVGKRAFTNCTSLNEIHLASYSEETFNFYNLEIGSGNDVITKDIFTFGLRMEEYLSTDSDYDVTVTCSSKAFDKEVKLSVEKTVNERENGSYSISDGKLCEQINLLNIKMIPADGSSTEAVQPGEKVTVKMAIPEEYIGRDNYKIVHRPYEGNRENFATNPKSGEKKLKISSDGKYWIFEIESFSNFEFYATSPAPRIFIQNNPGTKTIRLGEKLYLTANAENMPEGAKIFWYSGDEKIGEGKTIEISPDKNVEITVKIVDENGNLYDGDVVSTSQKVNVRNNFFDIIIMFFKKLFGLNKTIVQTLGIKTK